MSEGAPTGGHIPDETDADVIPLARHRAFRGPNSEALDPDKLTDREVIEAFLDEATQMIRGRSTEQVGQIVNRRIGGRPEGELNEAQLAWRQRTMGLMIDVDALDDEELDALLAKDHLLQELDDALRRTREKAKELPHERSAMLALRGLRAAVVEKRELQDRHNETHWNELIHHLGRAGLPRQGE